MGITDAFMFERIPALMGKYPNEGQKIGGAFNEFTVALGMGKMSGDSTGPLKEPVKGTIT